MNSISGTIKVSRISNTCTLYLKAIGVAAVVKDTPMTFGTALPTGFLPISSGKSANFAVMISATGGQSLGNLIISPTGFIMLGMIQPLNLQDSTVVGGYTTSCAVINGGTIPLGTTVRFNNDIYITYLCA